MFPSLDSPLRTLVVQMWLDWSQPMFLSPDVKINVAFSSFAGSQPCSIYNLLGQTGPLVVLRYSSVRSSLKPKRRDGVLVGSRSGPE